MNIEDFRLHGKEIIDWISNYFNTIEERSPQSQVMPRDIINSLPPAAPQKGESFEQIMKDFETKILPGITHWQHPKFFGYFPSNSSYPSVLAETLTAALGVQGMIWLTSPAAAELEEMMMNWLRDMIGLPKSFTGVIQDTASTSTLVSLLTAREVKTNYTINRIGFTNKRFTAYCSTEAHSSIEKAVKIAGIGSDNLRKIPVDKNFSMLPDKLENQIKKDIEDGFEPLFLVIALGTTSSTGVDNVRALSEIGRRFGIWIHIDAAYSGTALVLPEYQSMIDGIDNVDTFVFNPHKWMMTNFDASAYFVQDKEALVKTFEIHPEYLKTSADSMTNNYRDWGIQLGRRFRALKLWFVIRTYGIEGIQAKIRHDIALGMKFKDWVVASNDFELLAEPEFNLVCFRFKPEGIEEETVLEELNIKLLKSINESGKMFMTHTKLNVIYTLRFICAQTYVQERHVKEAWELIQSLSSKLIKDSV